MLIINADDFGRSVAETDAALRCYVAGRITSVSAMVFMADSERAAELAKEKELDVGLHLNFTERFTGKNKCARLTDYQNRVSHLPWAKQVFAAFLQSTAAKGVFLFMQGTGRGVHASVWKATITHRWAPSHAFVR